MKLILGPDVTAVGFDDNLTYIKTQAGSLSGFSKFISNSVETLKNLLQFRFRYAYS